MGAESGHASASSSRIKTHKALDFLQFTEDSRKEFHCALESLYVCMHDLVKLFPRRWGGLVPLVSFTGC